MLKKISTHALDQGFLSLLLFINSVVAVLPAVAQCFTAPLIVSAVIQIYSKTHSAHCLRSP